MIYIPNVCSTLMPTHSRAAAAAAAADAYAPLSLEFLPFFHFLSTDVDLRGN